MVPQDDKFPHWCGLEDQQEKLTLMRWRIALVSRLVWKENDRQCDGGGRYDQGRHGPALSFFFPESYFLNMIVEKRTLEIEEVQSRLKQQSRKTSGYVYSFNIMGYLAVVTGIHFFFFMELSCT